MGLGGGYRGLFYGTMPALSWKWAAVHHENPQYNRPPDRFEPSDTECLQLDHDVRYFSTEYPLQ